MDLAANELAVEYHLRTTIFLFNIPWTSAGKSREVTCGQRPCPREDSQLAPSTNATGVPFATLAATRSASQLVRRTQPCDSALEIFPGQGVP